MGSVVIWVSTEIENWLKEQAELNGRAPPSGPLFPEGARFLRMPMVKSLTGLSARTIYRKIQAGKFPKQVPLKL
jgi:predicted DNA-binding transcriptional regulator AlpA